MLKEPVPSLRRAMAGSALVLMLACCASASVWAAKPPVYVSSAPGLTAKPEKNTKIALNIDGVPARAVAKKAASLSGVILDNDDRLSAQKVSMHFASVEISTVMKILAEESGVVAGWQGDHVRFVSKEEAKDIKGDHVRLVSNEDAKAKGYPTPEAAVKAAQAAEKN